MAQPLAPRPEAGAGAAAAAADNCRTLPAAADSPAADSPAADSRLAAGRHILAAAAPGWTAGRPARIPGIAVLPACLPCAYRLRRLPHRPPPHAATDAVA